RAVRLYMWGWCGRVAGDREEACLAAAGALAGNGAPPGAASGAGKLAPTCEQVLLELRQHGGFYASATIATLGTNGRPSHATTAVGAVWASALARRYSRPLPRAAAWAAKSWAPTTSRTA